MSKLRFLPILLVLLPVSSGASASTLRPGDLLILEELIVPHAGSPYDGGSVVRLDPDTESQTQIASSLAFDQPIDFAMDAAGNISILEADNDEIYRFDGSGAPLGVISVDPLGQGSLLGNRIGLSVVPVPEPSTALLLATGLGAMAVGQKRRMV